MIDYAFYKNWNIFCQDVGTEHKDVCVCVCVCVTEKSKLNYFWKARKIHSYQLVIAEQIIQVSYNM